MVPVENAHSSQPRTISVMLPDNLLKSAYTEKTLDAFLQMYIPRGDVRATNAESKELVDLLPLLTIREEALQMAVLAIGTAALGQYSHDDDLKRKGRSLYGKALSETAVALRNPARAKSEALLVVPRLMALFEILFSADKTSHSQSDSWLSHAVGEMALITSRRPEEYSYTDTAHSLFVNGRFRLLISAVRMRKRSILNNEEWKTLPWKGRIKTPADTLLDIFCGAPELMEAMEKIYALSLNARTAEGLRVQTLAKAWTLHLDLEAWIEANSEEIYTPEHPTSLSLISFPNFEIASQTLRYWVVCLLVYHYHDLAAGISPASDSLTTHPDRPHPRKFARYIARSVSYFFEERHGVTGATTMSFPLGMTLFYMKNNIAADGPYMGMIMKAWNDPKLPSAIRDFLASFKESANSSIHSRKPVEEL